MQTPFSCNLYENPCLTGPFGLTMRPGALDITKKAMGFCRLKPGSCLLDVGCGLGASVECLINEYGLHAKGIDSSDKMLRMALNRNGSLPVRRGSAENTGFPDGGVDAVLCECTLSHVNDIDIVLHEFYRILKNAGFLILSDLYMREAEKPIADTAAVSARSGIVTKTRLFSCLEDAGFHVSLFEDHSRELAELICRIIFQFGSMNEFYAKAGITEKNCFSSVAISQGKPGYYLLIAEK